MREQRCWRYVLWLQHQLRYRAKRREGRGRVRALLAVLLRVMRG